MNIFQKKFYNQRELWVRNFSEIPGENERVDKVIDIIPSDIETILDVGCGNGFFLNKLIKEKKYINLVGIDISEEAIKQVKSRKIVGDIGDLPFKAESFDLVVCLEVLEHLPQEIFDKGVLELQRVSKKYILITVPNNENLEYSLVKCPKCCCRFHPSSHIRSFKEEILKNLFCNFKLIKILAIGPYVYPSFLLNLYRVWKVLPVPPTAICPQCGYQNKQVSQNEDNEIKPIFSLCRLIAKLISRLIRKKTWLLALYARN